MTSDRTMSPDEVAASCWDYALAVYSQPGVSPACLALQNSAGVDVMMMLGLIYAAVRMRVVVTDEDIAAVDAACSPWREQVVRPLRAVRVALKTGPAPAPNSQSELLRNRIKSSELEAEQLQNSLVAKVLCERFAQASLCLALDKSGLESLLKRIAAAVNPRIPARLDHEFSTIADAALAVAQSFDAQT